MSNPVINSEEIDRLLEESNKKYKEYSALNSELQEIKLKVQQDEATGQDFADKSVEVTKAYDLYKQAHAEYAKAKQTSRVTF